MSLTTTALNSLLKAVVLGTDPSWRDATGQPNFYLALHTATPTAAGSYADEATYTSYARVAVVRSAAGWTVADGGDGTSAGNAALIQFPECTGALDSEEVTYLSIGTAASGGTMLAFSQLIVSRTVTLGIQPQLLIAALQLEIT